MTAVGDGPIQRREYGFLALIMIGAALVRLAGLTRDSFWSDEAFSAYSTLFDRPIDVMQFIRGDVHPPGYFLTLWSWTRLFGIGEYAIRMFSVVGGILFIPVVFRVGRQLFGVQTGLLAAFLGAFLIQSVYFSQEARAYSWMATLAALSVSLAIDYWRKPRPSSLWPLAATTLILGYFHYFGLLLAAVLWAGLAMQRHLRGGSGSSLIGCAVLAAGYAPWVPTMLAQRGRSNWIPPPDVGFVAQLFNVYFGPGMPVDVWVALFLIAGVGVAIRRQALQFRSPENALLLWILIPLAIALVASLFIRPVYTPRNMLIGTGAAVLLLARMVEWIHPKRQFAWILAITLIVGMYGIHFGTGKGYMIRPVKQQVREATNFILERNDSQLPVYAVGWDHTNFVYYFRLAGNKSGIRVIGEPEFKSSGLSGAVRDEEFWIASAGIDIGLFDNFRIDFDVLESGDFIEARAYRLRRKRR